MHIRECDEAWAVRLNISKECAWLMFHITLFCSHFIYIRINCNFMELHLIVLKHKFLSSRIFCMFQRMAETKRDELTDCDSNKNTYYALFLLNYAIL